MFEAFKWTVAALSVIGVVMNIRKNRNCFKVWAVSNASWVIIDVYHEVWSQAALQSVYFCLAIWGIIEWRKTS